ncbi:MAG: hypothetical protein R3264_01030 [Anaerolineae bacterium]|nr:hypothetical protein [Anaerolineae bacterium]
MAALLEWFRLNWGLLTFIAIIVVAFFFLRNTPTPGIDTLANLEQVTHSGEPVVLDFYSNF